jgi:hypothetical protein
MSGRWRRITAASMVAAVVVATAGTLVAAPVAGASAPKASAASSDLLSPVLHSTLIDDVSYMYEEPHAIIRDDE